MNVTCHVTQRTTNRICLSVPGSAAEPELGQFLAQFVLRVPGVAGVEIWPGSESVVILYDGGRSTGEAILNALRGKQLPAPNTQPGLQLTSDTGSARESIPGSVTTAPTAPAAAERLPLARYEVLHAMRGRVRLHIPVLKTEKGLGAALAHHLGDQPGVKTVRINRMAANVVVTFDPAASSANQLVAEVAGYNPEPAEIEHWLAVEDAAELDAGQRHSRQKIEMAMVLGALALPMFFGAAAGFVAQLLFWGSIASMLHRTYRFVSKDRRATLDAAAAAGMALLLLVGMSWQAALIPIAFVAVPWLRSKLAAQQAKPATMQGEAEDDVVIFIPSAQNEGKVTGKKYGKNAVEPLAASSATTAGTSHNALRSSIVGGLAVWVASKSVQRAARKATLKAEKAAR
ncbi:MAG: hypothetical protein U0X20_04855 [Caldilineaceae bacterium]